ncbi:interferon gamma receptor 2 [Alligator mississippiensis]|uniref:Tissue factor n=1 Tax=Alligator mississippiensis TaxID=8496 RepID=A0A151ME45_ALLMI|nr:interferon gamma receptor 2 [Alligator mississippiensis]KYO22781.1 interferon gamma receptor 2 [Alligator mississippiensis]
MLPLLLLLLVPGGIARALSPESASQLPAPQNVTIDSRNFYNLLRWAPVQVEKDPVFYTVQYKTQSYDKWGEINCTHIAETKCNFTSTEIQSHWITFFRVRSELEDMQSDWVETDAFMAAKDTIVGPLTLKDVVSNPDSLLLNFLPPLGKVTSIFDVEYLVHYWEKSTAIKKTITTRNTQVELQNLRQLTEYCFQIQAAVKHSLRSYSCGLLSNTSCHQTTMSDGTKAGYILLIFVVTIIVVVGVAMVFFYLGNFNEAIKAWSQPSLKIPSHIEEYLNDPDMPVFEDWENTCVEVDHWDSLSVVSKAEGSQTEA